MAVATHYCEKCNKTMKADQFYATHNKIKYPTGLLNQCKKCITMHVDNFKPDTFLPILKECDVPYVPKEWDKLLAKYGANPADLTSMSIIGRYLGSMRLKQFKDYRWEHNEFLLELAKKEMEETMKRQGYDNVEIARALNEAGNLKGAKNAVNMVASYEYDGDSDVLLINPQGLPPEEPEDYFAKQSGNDLYQDDFISDLTDEDRTYLRLKWGKTYKPEEWIRLEQLYEEMMASYDIQGAGHIDTLKLVCKTSLKANQLIDIGDIEGFQKMQKAYDSLMKSGKFTAAQNKAESGEFVDSIGELIELCEKQGYIERYYIESPKDRVDLTIADMQRYTRTLIEEETNLPNMVEKALREIDKEDKDSAANNEDSIVDDIELSLDDLEATLKDKDFIDFEDFLDEESAADEDYLSGEDW